MMSARGRVAVFLLGVLVLFALAGLESRHGSVIDANLLSLLPHETRAPAIEKAVKLITARTERAHVMLVSAPDAPSAKKAADLAAQSLAATGLYSHIAARVDMKRYLQLGRFYFDYRYRLITPPLIRQIDADPEQMVAGTLRRLYRPAGGGASLAHDPFFLLEQYLGTRATGGRGALQVEDGYLITETSDKRFHVLVSGELATSPFDVAAQERLEAAKARLGTELAPLGASIRYAGVIEHAAAGTRTGQAEMKLVGSISLAGVLLLLVLFFRSARPILASFLTIFIGIGAGFSACVLVFGNIHLVSLVAGTSLIGISIDYALHYFVARADGEGRASPQEALAHIMPGISLGLVTSLAGFAALLLAPFPGLRQLAVFSGAGLIASYLSVVCLFPRIAGRTSRPLPQGLVGLSAAWLRVWAPKRRFRQALLVAIIGAAGYALALVFLTSQDDVRLLRTPDRAAGAAEAFIKSVTGRNVAPQFFLVTGASPEDVLQSEEGLAATLATQQFQPAVGGYVALTDYVPSLARQNQSLAAARKLAAGSPSVASQLGAQIGFDGDMAAQLSDDLTKARGRPLTLQTWLDADLLPEVARLWLGQLGTKAGAPVYGTVMLVNDAHDLGLLARAAASEKGVTFVDNVADISAILGLYRHRAQWLLVVAYIGIGLALSFRYGARESWLVMVPPLAAAGVAVGGLALLGEPYNLFNVVGLTLVLGIGIDYTLFFREVRHDQAGTGLAILLAALSTMLAFGLLAFSSMPALHSFGLTILLGITAALIFAPLALASQSREGEPI